MTHRFGKLRRFRFNRPQQIAVALLGLFLLQGLWVTSHQTLSDQDYRYARCGRETWETASPLAGYYTSCGNIHDGIIAYRLAGLPLTLNLLAEEGLDHFRPPEDRVVQENGEISTWELRHQMTHVLLLLRLPFLLAGCVLGGCIWWVTRRLYGDLGGFTALALYCFCPAILRACLQPTAEVLAALGVYGSVYTCIGVAHSMQGPQRRWRPRIVLLTLIFGIAAASHIAALPVAALLGLLLMIYVGVGHRSQSLPIVLFACLGALLLVFACYGFSPDAYSYVFRSSAGFVWFSLNPARHFFSALPEAGITVGVGAAFFLFLGLPKARYFGNTAPLFCAAVLMGLVMTGAPGSPWLWSIPFWLTFIGGVFADAFESPHPRMALSAAAALVVLQALLCVMNLPSLV